jgi:hypothetical protein
MRRAGAISGEARRPGERQVNNLNPYEAPKADLRLDPTHPPRRAGLDRSAFISAATLWLVLHVIPVLPVILDPNAILRMYPLYLAGIAVFLEPLFCFWAYYRYRYIRRRDIESRQRDDFEA